MNTLLHLVPLAVPVHVLKYCTFCILVYICTALHLSTDVQSTATLYLFTHTLY